MPACERWLVYEEHHAHGINGHTVRVCRVLVADCDTEEEAKKLARLRKSRRWCAWHEYTVVKTSFGPCNY